ncbi:hypothetical protein [Burkholderia ubonensis]|uniref:hypothetical protein n=1 Tax=Burkholderia ubonensis TaxID=101571 RepID=UPI0012BA7176|nr:hypothetical protein [Burkholderia ubonensis]
MDKTIEEFRTGKLELDCRRIVLSQNSEGGERYEGKGYIRQNTDGVLVFKVYVTNHENATPHGALFNEMRHFGKVRPDELYFNLAAEVRGGMQLRASRLMPNVLWTLLGEPDFISGQLHSVTVEPSLPQVEHVLELHFFEELPVPKTDWSEVEGVDGTHLVTDAAEFDAGGSHFKVRVREGSGRSVVVVTSSEAFSPGYYWRIQEALQFVIGRTVTVGACVTCGPGFQKAELFSPTRSSVRPHFCPPIKHSSIAYLRHGWALFSAYLTYVVNSSSATLWNPLAYHLYNARESSANSLDSWAMGVSVALEAVASLVSLPENFDRQGETEAAVRGLKRYIAGHAELGTIKDRVIGLLGMLEHPPGPRDKLKWLAAQGKAEKAYIQQWTDLRNAHVHPRLIDLEQPSQTAYQKQLDRIHSVQVLLCQITYYLIGFCGPYTDYAAEGYPEKDYPLVAPNPADA